MNKKNIIIIIIIIILIVVVAGAYFAYSIYKNANAGCGKNCSTNQNVQNTNSGNYEMIQGMKVEILKEGTGAQAKQGDMVTVDYVGTLENGTKFDSSIDRGTPFQFTLGVGQVIKGWDLGVLGMRVGEKRKLTIPSELGYGSSGAGGVIPPNATLIFEVDRIK